jgi:hypothetical protein
MFRRWSSAIRETSGSYSSQTQTLSSHHNLLIQASAEKLTPKRRPLQKSAAPSLKN